MKLTDEQITEGLVLAEKSAPGPWEVREIDDGKPRQVDLGDGTTYCLEPRYFKFVDGQQIFCAAYDIPQLKSLGDHECGAAEKHNADFVASARNLLPAALEELQERRRKVRVNPKYLSEHSSRMAACPDCGDRALNGREKYCPGCGHEIDWSTGTEGSKPLIG